MPTKRPEVINLQEEMEEQPENLLLILDILEADKEEAMVVEAEVEEATEELQGEEEKLKVGTKLFQLSNAPSVNSLMTEEGATGPTLAREYISAACAWVLVRPAYWITPIMITDPDMEQTMGGGELESLKLSQS